MGRLQNPTAGRLPVPSGSGRLSLFRTIETARNRTEPPVNRRLGFEAVPVQYQSALSVWKTLSCGVPQGTPLGPITFIAIIKSASEDSATKSFRYVDDLNLGEVRIANQSNQIGQDVQDLDAWAKDNYLTLNPSKCKVMQVCFKKEVPALQIAGIELKVVSRLSFLV